MSAPCPPLRALEIFPTEHDGRRLLCVRDPSGLSPHVAMLPYAAMLVISSCDGARTPAEVAHEAGLRLGGSIDPSQVEELVAQLDAALLLDTPRFHAHVRRVTEEFRASPSRAASHAGQSYPAEAPELRALLDRHLHEAARRAPGAGSPVCGIIAPHIDFARGAAVYADIYHRLRDRGSSYDLVLVFGTNHSGVAQPLTLTRKSYDTPLGQVTTDCALVEALAQGDDGALFAEELHHKHEHSLEFQAVWLRHVLGERMPMVLPILCGPLGECAPGRAGARGRVRDFLHRLRALVAGRRVLALAGADLAHVGPRFGDDRFDPIACAAVEDADRRALAAVTDGQADAFWEAVAAERDRYRVCGLAPIFAMLAWLEDRPRRGTLLSYAQCPADAEHTSWVSIAAAELA